ncbi:MAG TPA: hypothetical protein VMM56_07020 [Planctomycetaceae bacterium]|nr:hypothetical protein [Planctomycetaceae bacterium]
MVEAAFRPAASWHAMLLGPILLHELGIIDLPQEMALHISIQGAIGDQIRYLATCASFIHTGRRKRPHRALTRVMSKGLVCRNSEIEQCVPELPAQSRTEIRLHRCFAEADENDRVSLDMSYIDDILATHLLATAAMSPERDLAELYVAFGDAVANAIGQLPPEFAEYLTSDFYQSTGDPHDPELLDFVPIVRKFKEIREIVKRDGLRAELEQTFLRIRDDSVWRILKVLTGSKAAALKEWDPDRSPHSNLWA